MGPRKLTSPFFLYSQKQFLEMYPISIKKQTYCAKIRLKISPCLMEVFGTIGARRKKKENRKCFFFFLRNGIGHKKIRDWSGKHVYRNGKFGEITPRTRKKERKKIRNGYKPLAEWISQRQTALAWHLLNFSPCPRAHHKKQQRRRRRMRLNTC